MNLFHKLSPHTDSEYKNVYNERIQAAIKDKDIRNVGISGPYGSGKSTVIHSFTQRYKNYNPITVSLAHFCNNSNTKENESQNKESITKENESQNKESIINEIETSILKQIFYQLDISKIPFSKFHRIKNISKLSILAYSLLLAIFIFLSLSFFFDNKSPLYSFLEKWQIILVLILGITFIFQQTYIFLKKGKINKITSKYGEFGINQKSILNKNIDELIYYFQVSECEVVIFEDLDRFSKIQIFTTLREINFIINNAPEIKEKGKKITFLYAIRDDLFKTNIDRTKFFDLIIPVIPIVNSTNSGDVFIQELQKIDGYNSIFDSALEKRLIYNICLYLTDMRLIKNIINEFVVYDEKLTDPLINKNKLLSIIAYKNIFPEDYNDLQIKKGFIYTIFNNFKETFINDAINNLEQKINKNKEKINDIQEEKHNDIIGLRREYIYAFINYKIKNEKYGFLFTSEKLTPDDFITSEKFDAIISADAFIINEITTGSSLVTRSISWKDIESVVEHKKSFSERKNDILTKTDGTLKELFSKLNQLEARKNSITTSSLYDVLKLVPNWDSIFIKTTEDKSFPISPSILENKSLIKFLLSEGYITEDYEMYNSFFYEGRFTKNDRAFLINIRERKQDRFDLEVNNPQEIINILYTNDFSSSGIYNYNFFNYLVNLNNKDYFPKYSFNGIFKEFNLENFYALDFAFKYIDHLTNTDSKNLRQHFIRYFTDYFKDIWFYIKTDNYLSTRKDFYLKILLTSSLTKESLKSINAHSYEGEGFSKDISAIQKVDYELENSIFDVFEDIYVQFTSLEQSNNPKFLDEVYARNVLAP